MATARRLLIWMSLASRFVNFAIRSIRVERREWKEEAESKIKSLLPPAKIVPQVTNASVNASSNRSVEEVESLASAKQRYGNEKKRHARVIATFRSIFQGHGKVTVSRLAISSFNGEGFEVCPSLWSGNGVCEASGSCKCADGYRDSDCSDEVCIGGCGVHGKCDLKNGNVAAILASR